MISFKNFTSKFKKKETTAPKSYPDSSEANQWMTDTVAHAIKHNPKDAHNLFSPASGDYLPLKVHVGSSFKKEHLDHYRELKKEHPELVAKAKKVTTGLAGQISLSRVGDDEDYHGMSIRK